MKLAELLSLTAAETAQADEPQATPPVAELFVQTLQRVDEACAAACAELRAVPDRARVYVQALAALSAAPQS